MEGIAIIALFFLYMCVKTDIKRLEWKIDRLENKRKNDDDAVQTVAAAATDVDTTGTAPTSLSADVCKKTPAAARAAREENHTPAAISATVLKEKKSAFSGQSLTVWIAGFAAVLGFFYFVRYSIEQGLLTPAARLTITALCGIALTFGGVFIRARKSSDNSKKIGEAFIGIGLAALYFAAYALSGIYRLAPESLSFGLMCLITAAGVALTMLTNCNSGIILALIGGFLTPALKTDGGSTVVLASYLFVLTSTLLCISRRTGSFFLSLLTFCGCGFWLLFALLTNFSSADSIVFFVLMAAVNLASGYIFSGNNEEQKNLRQIPLLFAVIFTFLMLLKTDFDFQEWSIIAVMLCGLTALCLFRRQEHIYLLTAADIAVFVLLGYWHMSGGDACLFWAVFAAIALVPLYVAGWVRPYRAFLLLPASLAPFISLAAYPVYAADVPVAYVSIIAAAAFALQILRLNLRQQDNRNLAGYLVLSATTLAAIALLRLLDNDDMTPVVATTVLLIFGVLRDRFAIGRLNGGLLAGALLFFVCEYDELTDACRQLFLGTLDSVRLHPESLQYYLCRFVFPAAAFTVLAFAGRGLVRFGAAAVAFLLGCFGLFSLFMLSQITPGEQWYVVADFTDNILLTALLLCAALPYALNRQKTFGAAVFAVGLWRLFFDGLANSPMFNGIPVDAADILLAYGVPFIIFAVCAVAPKGIHKNKFALAAAVMSFVLVSALLTYGLYGKLYLRSISFDDGGIFAYSALWLVLGGIWLALGFYDRVLVKPAFALIYLVVGKVFLYDVSSLEDVWRIAALFGLAGSLFAVSYVYGRWFAPAKENSSAG